MAKKCLIICWKLAAPQDNQDDMGNIMKLGLKISLHFGPGSF